MRVVWGCQPSASVSKLEISHSKRRQSEWFGLQLVGVRRLGAEGWGLGVRLGGGCHKCSAVREEWVFSGNKG